MVVAKTWILLVQAGPAAALAWAALSVAVYTGAARLIAGEWGFPLDDAWIHQTLARSLAHEGMLAVNPGEPSAASTAPLWTALLAVGQAAGAPPVLWAAALGALCHAAAALLAAALARRLFPALPLLPPAALALTALDWRLAWGAASGMESGLFVALALALLRLGAAADTPLPLLGLAGGLAALTRPEGGLLFLGALAARLWQAPGRRAAAVGAAGALAVAAAAFAPVALYHLSVLGSPLPATFFAKRAFYQEPLSLGLLARYLPALGAFLLSGAFLPLAPWALALAGAALLRRQRPGPGRLLALGWLLGLPLLYLLTLPYLYHHGRYLFPVLPLTAIYGAAGLLTLGPKLPFRLLPRAAALLAGVTAVALWVNGAVVLGWDVRVITGQQVRAARWIAANTAPDAVAATHDIGALSYFGGRRLVDMAGLITPALTATPRDRERITAVLRREGVGYVALLPDWYPWFPGDLPANEVYRAAAPYLARLGFQEFRVYRLSSP